MTQIVSEISRNYAKALVETASENNSHDLFIKQLNDISETISISHDLNLVINNSSISTFKKLEIIDSIFNGKIDKRLQNLLKILVEKNRFNEFESIKRSFNDYINNLNNKKFVEIVSPIALNFETKSNILFKLEHKLKCEITPTWTVDENLIAGLVFKFDDYVIDTSIRSKLDNLSKIINR